MCKTASVQRFAQKGIWICNLSLSDAFSNLSTRHRQETKPLDLRASEILGGLCGALFSGFKKICSLGTKSISHFIYLFIFAPPYLVMILGLQGLRLLGLIKKCYFTVRSPETPEGSVTSDIQLQVSGSTRTCGTQVSCLQLWGLNLRLHSKM